MVIHEIYIDIVPGARKKTIWLSQYDDDFLIKANLYASQGDFSLPAGTAAEIRLTKPDGNGYSASASLNGNTVTVTGDKQITAVYGKCTCEITLYKDEKELNSENFFINIEKAPLDMDTIPSESVIREINEAVEMATHSVRFDEAQSLTSEQKAIARANIGADESITVDTTPTEGSSNAVSSGGVYTALANKQETLTFDNVPTQNSNNPVKSGGIYSSLAGKQDALTFDNAPTQNSQNSLKSGAVYSALSGKQDNLTFDDSPTQDSQNPVKSGGLYTALQGKQDNLTLDNSPTSGSNNPVKSGGVYSALANKQNTLTFDNTPTQDSNNPVKSGGVYASEQAIRDSLTHKRYGVAGVGKEAATLTRIWDSVGLTAQVGTDGDNSAVVNDFDFAAPFMRRKCVGEWSLVDGRPKFTVNAYLGDDDYAEDGTMGDYVAVECPRCYYYRDDDMGILGVSDYQYDGWRPFDIFCRGHDPNDTIEKAYIPAYALALKDGKAVSLPGLDNAQGAYNTLVSAARTYKSGALGNNAILMPAAYSFYEWALITVEFATQNCQSVMNGCCNLRHNADDRAVFTDATHILTSNYQAGRVAGQYLAIIATNVDINSPVHQATHKALSVTRCDENGVSNSSGTHQLIELQDLGKGYAEYDTTGATEYRIAARPYRTGDCNDVSTPSGSPVSNADGYHPCKYRWKENPYANQFQTTMDVFDKKSGTGDSDYFLDWYYLPNPTLYTPGSNKPDVAELDTDLFTKLDIQTPHENYVNGYIKSRKYSRRYPDIWIPQKTTGGSTTTYYCDYAYLVNSPVVRSLRFGGNWYNGANCGFYPNANNAPGYAYAYYGGNLFIHQCKAAPIKPRRFRYTSSASLRASAFPWFPPGTEIIHTGRLSRESKGVGIKQSMKRVKNTWRKVVDTTYGVRAIIEGTQYKRGNAEVAFLLDENKYHEIDVIKAAKYADDLTKKLKSKTWQHGKPKYRQQFCRNKSKAGGKWRDLYIPSLSDHIIAHMVMAANMKAFTRGMHPHCCGSVPGRGIKHVLYNVSKWLRCDKECRYFVKLDIRKFFDHIDRDILKEKLRRKIMDQNSLWVFDQIIDSAPVACPVGYYTSPWFANLYLQDLDWFIAQRLYKERRGKRINYVRHFIRYMDDILLIGTSRADLKKSIQAIRQFIKPLGLELKTEWEIKAIGKKMPDGKLKPETYWIDLCGYKFCKGCTIMRDGVYLSTKRSAKTIKKKGYSAHRCQGINSKIAWAQKCNSHNFINNDIKPYVDIRSVRRYISDVEKKSKRRKHQTACESGDRNACDYQEGL